MTGLLAGLTVARTTQPHRQTKIALKSDAQRRGGVVLVWEGVAYGWKNEWRDPASERPGPYAVDMAVLIFKAEDGDDYDGAKAWVAVDPDAQ